MIKCDTMEKFKIDVVTKYFYPIAAGIETNILETYKVLAKKGWNVTIHTSKDTYLEKDTLKESEQIQGLNVKRYSFDSDTAGYKPDIDWGNTNVVALHNFNVSHFRILLKVLWLKITGKKKFALVITPHGGFTPDWRIFSLTTRLKKFVYQHFIGRHLANIAADGFRAVSEWEKEQMIEKGLKPEKIEVITNGLEDEAFLNVEKLATKSIKEKVKKFGKYIIQIGRIYPIKNYETTIKALPLIDPAVNFVIAGTVADEKYFEYLKKLAKDLGVENRVLFAGVVRGVDKYYLIKKAKIMVHMARWESFCNVVHEGLSQGLVCIVADNTALPLLVKDGVNGFVSKTKDHKGLAQKINYVLDNFDSKEISTMRENNKKIGLNDSWKSVAEKMSRFYNHLVDQVAKSSFNFFSFAGKILVCVIVITAYLLTIRGNWNTPSPQEIDTRLYNTGQAFETSQERSRYALLLSLVNDKRFSIDNYASMGTPDIGFVNGHYYSFFPPGASLLAIPLYLLGLKVGATQIFTFSISTIFALLTFFMIVKYSKSVGLHWSKALFAAISFAFATNAWGYSVTLYAHIISAFLIISALYIATTKEIHTIKDALLFWFIYAFAVFVDFPNLFIFLPIALIFTLSGLSHENLPNRVSLKIKTRYLVAPLLFICLMGFYGYYNYLHFGNPTTLSNSIPRVKDLKTTITAAVPEKEKSSVGALDTRDMLEGFSSFTINSDRGLLIYSPIVLLSVLSILSGSLLVGWKQKIGLTAVPFTCLTLYSMFGDPYGGWAFGSRYMIAVIPELAILGGLALNSMNKSVLTKILFTIVFLYSLWVSLLAPLTTNVIPPKVEAGTFGLKNDYQINIEMLNNNNLNSFVFNNYVKPYMNGWQYYWAIYSLVGTLGVALIWVKSKPYETNTI